MLGSRKDDIVNITERGKLVKFRQTIKSQFGCQLPVIHICRQLALSAGLRIGAFDDKTVIAPFRFNVIKLTFA